MTMEYNITLYKKYQQTKKQTNKKIKKYDQFYTNDFWNQLRGLWSFIASI